MRNHPEREESKPPITLSNGRVVRHYRQADDVTVAESDGPELTEEEWIEYCSLFFEQAQGVE